MCYQCVYKVCVYTAHTFNIFQYVLVSAFLPAFVKSLPQEKGQIGDVTFFLGYPQNLRCKPKPGVNEEQLYIYNDV